MRLTKKTVLSLSFFVLLLVAMVSGIAWYTGNELKAQWLNLPTDMADTLEAQGLTNKVTIRTTMEETGWWQSQGHLYLDVQSSPQDETNTLDWAVTFDHGPFPWMQVKNGHLLPEQFAFHANLLPSKEAGGNLLQAITQAQVSAQGYFGYLQSHQGVLTSGKPLTDPSMNLRFDHAQVDWQGKSGQSFKTSVQMDRPQMTLILPNMASQNMSSQNSDAKSFSFDFEKHYNDQAQERIKLVLTDFNFSSDTKKSSGQLLEVQTDKQLQTELMNLNAQIKAKQIFNNELPMGDWLIDASIHHVNTEALSSWLQQLPSLVQNTEDPKAVLAAYNAWTKSEPSFVLKTFDWQVPNTNSQDAIDVHAQGAISLTPSDTTVEIERGSINNVALPTQIWPTINTKNTNGKLTFDNNAFARLLSNILPPEALAQKELIASFTTQILETAKTNNQVIQDEPGQYRVELKQTGEQYQFNQRDLSIDEVNAFKKDLITQFSNSLFQPNPEQIPEDSTSDTQIPEVTSESQGTEFQGTEFQGTESQGTDALIPDNQNTEGSDASHP